MLPAPRTSSTAGAVPASLLLSGHGVADWLRFVRSVRRLTLLAISAAILSGCQSWQKNHQQAIQSFAAGRLDDSDQHLKTSLATRRAEQNVLLLDSAIVDLASGRTAEAETTLRTVRRELEHLSQSDLAESTGSILTDDRARAFCGRSFEQQMVLNVLLMTSLVNQGHDSFAYSLQLADAMHDRREELRSAVALSSGTGKASLPGTAVVPASFPNNGGQTEISPAGDQAPTSGVDKLAVEVSEQTLALGAYLAALVQSESPTHLQETERFLQSIGTWNAALRPPDGSLPFPLMGVRCQPGHGALHVLVMVGRAPEWVAETSAPTSASLLIADRILSVTGKHTLPPTIAPVRISRPQPRSRPPVDFVRCSIQAAGGTADGPSQMPLPGFQTLVDVNAVAESHYHQHRDDELARAVVRRIVKKGAVYVVKEAQSVYRNTAVDLAVNVAGIAWEAMEKPDTRSWRLLPARVDVVQSELPAGSWVAELRTADGRRHVTVPVRIENGRNTCVLCFLPDAGLTGHVLIGGADQGSVDVSARNADH